MWRASPATGGFARSAPELAVAVGGTDDTADRLREKARWYLAHGVATVWLVAPTTQTVTILTRDGESEHEAHEHLPEPEGLPGLSPLAGSFFEQLT